MARNSLASRFRLPNAAHRVGWGFWKRRIACGVPGLFHPRRLTVALLSMACVLLLTHIPQAALPRALRHTLFDKFEHLAAYGVVALLFVLSMKRPVRLLPLSGTLLVLALIGALDEVTQPLVNRQASIMDYLADLTGIAFVSVSALFRGSHRIHVKPQRMPEGSHTQD